MQPEIQIAILIAINVMLFGTLMISGSQLKKFRNSKSTINENDMIGVLNVTNARTSVRLFFFMNIITIYLSEIHPNTTALVIGMIFISVLSMLVTAFVVRELKQ